LNRALVRVAVAIGALLLVLACAFALLLAALDAHQLDGLFARLVSARLHRPVRFATLDAHLLSRDPHITVRGLVIDNPPRLHGGHLAEADWLRVGLDGAALWHGSLRLRTVAARGLHLHLIRFGPRNNNWTFTTSPGTGPAFEPLRSVERLVIADGRIDIKDLGRQLEVAGSFRHDASGARPVHMAGAGTLAGFPVSVRLQGGQLHGAGVGPPWPFAARIVDGDTMVDANGTSGDAFNFGSFDLAIAAQGPNLADLGYLFHFIVPNSAPYRLRMQGRSDGSLFDFSGLSGIVGRSDVTGWIRSDHGQARRQIRAGFALGLLDRTDIEALLAPIPTRALARRTSGAVRVAGTGRWLLPDAPFGLDRMRMADFSVAIRAQALGGFALPLRNLATSVTLQQGLLRFTPFTSDLYGGRLVGAGSLNARQDVPRLTVQGRLRDARLAQTPMGNALGPNARLDLTMKVQGRGRSIHDAAGNAAGTIGLHATGAMIPRRAAWIMGGDLLRALGASGKAATVPVSCAAIDLGGSGGPFAVRGFRIESPLGTASGSGSVDFGQERMTILLQGHPSEKRLFQVATPLRIAGPLMAPVLTVLPGDHARKLGLKGKLGVALSPIVGILPLGHDKPKAASTNVGC
jgi:uncharacterized protein involved in outer membrane biogenesis